MDFTVLLHVVNKLQQVCRINQVARTLWKSDLLQITWYLQTCCKLLKQFASSLWRKSLDNQLTASLSTACSRLVTIKPEQAMWTHPDISLMTARQQACSRLATTCAFLAMYALVYIMQLLRLRINYQEGSRIGFYLQCIDMSKFELTKYFVCTTQLETRKLQQDTPADLLPCCHQLDIRMR